MSEVNELIVALKTKGITDAEVLRAMEKVARHRFIPESYRSMMDPYGDHPCPIGYEQTISQPYIVAYMTEKMHVTPGVRILEIGTGSGYQAAILAEMGADVFSIERIPELAARARNVLNEEGYEGVKISQGDGYEGWPQESPFEIIIVTCAPDEVPPKLVAQLKEGGRMIVPVGEGVQMLVVLQKKGFDIQIQEDLPVRFVPMVHGNL